MPYAMPSTPDEDKPSLPPVRLRPEHRRTHSSHAVFHTERSQGANALSNLPRRKLPAAKKAPMFHFTEDQDSDSSDEHSTRSEIPPAANTLGLKVDTTSLLSTNTHESSLPFPSKPSPSSPGSPNSAGVLPRTPSSPIIIHNGRPLKPSLKSSHSAPHIPGVRLHTRAQSEPSTPLVKNVHFPEQESIQSVRVFNSAGKPVSVSKSNPDETETDTDYDSSAKNHTSSTYPFSSSSSSSTIPTFQIDLSQSSPIPNPNPLQSANLHLETAVLPNMSPPLMRGSVVVRNMAFTKEVAVRFTLDDWQTTSEVICKHVVSLPDLPPPFEKPSTFGDSVARAAQLDGSDPWDRFSFSIRLEDFERRLAERVLWLVVRFTVPGMGEWWDNNQGKNYRFAFQRSVLPPIRDPTNPMNSQRHTFQTPPTLKVTPIGGTNADDRPFSPTGDSFRGTQSISYQKSASSRPAPSMPPIRSHHSLESVPIAPQPSPSMRSSLPSKLNLLNYAAPKSPITPPHSRRQSLVGSPTGEGTGDRKEFDYPRMGAIIGGMPTSTPPPNTITPSTSSSSTGSAAYPSPTTDSPVDNISMLSFSSKPGPAVPSESEYADFIKKWCFAQSPSTHPQESSPSSSPPTILEKIQPENGWLELGKDLMRVYSGSDRSMLAGM